MKNYKRCEKCGAFISLRYYPRTKKGKPKDICKYCTYMRWVRYSDRKVKEQRYEKR